MIAWLRHHWRSVIDALAKCWHAPIGTAMNVLVIGIALALPLGGFVALQNIRTIASGLESGTQISVFLAPEATRGDAKHVEELLSANEGVRDIRFVPREQALRDLARTANLQDVVAALRDNPLPDGLVITLENLDSAHADSLASLARSLPKVAHVQTDSAWSRRLDAAIELANAVVGILGLLLSLALVAVTLNTIRLQIMTQREEIEVCRLIGATDAYIQRPFYYFGALLGLLGGLFALSIVGVSARVLDVHIAGLASVYGSSFQIVLPGWNDSVSLLLFSSALGWLGAQLSVSIHLRAIN